MPRQEIVRSGSGRLKDLARVPSPKKGEVHLWALALDLGDTDLARLREALAPDERARAARMRRPHDSRFVAARGQLREILGRYRGVPPAGLRFAYGPSGKPRLLPEGPLRFNVSHCEDDALVAVSTGRDLGVDLERVRDDVDWEEIAEQLFSEEERAALGSLPAPWRRSSFFATWTQKEALLKALGCGLGGEEPKRPPGTARFAVLGVPAPPGHVASLAVEGGTPEVVLLEGARHGFGARGPRGTEPGKGEGQSA